MLVLADELEEDNWSITKVFHFCVDQDMKIRFEGNIEFGITRDAWKGTSQLG